MPYGGWQVANGGRAKSFTTKDTKSTKVLYILLLFVSFVSFVVRLCDPLEHVEVTPA
jgi:hypothetical protein